LPSSVSFGNYAFFWQLRGRFCLTFTELPQFELAQGTDRSTVHTLPSTGSAIRAFWVRVGGDALWAEGSRMATAGHLEEED
jgi:hypothetical protein